MAASKKPPRLRPDQLQIEPFVPPPLKPGDPPGLYGNRIPDRWMAEFDARFHGDPLDEAFRDSLRHAHAERYARQGDPEASCVHDDDRD